MWFNGSNQMSCRLSNFDCSSHTAMQMTQSSMCLQIESVIKSGNSSLHGWNSLLEHHLIPSRRNMASLSRIIKKSSQQSCLVRRWMPGNLLWSASGGDFASRWRLWSDEEVNQDWKLNSVSRKAHLLCASSARIYSCCARSDTYPHKRFLLTSP